MRVKGEMSGGIQEGSVLRPRSDKPKELNERIYLWFRSIQIDYGGWLFDADDNISPAFVGGIGFSDFRNMA